MPTAIAIPTSFKPNTDSLFRVRRFKRNFKEADKSTNVEILKGETSLSILEVLKSFISLFLSVSSIHGFNHITAKKRHPVEKLIWLSLLGCAVFGAAVLSSEMWIRYQENPTVISMERDRYSWNTTFPVATICPNTKLSKDLLNDYVEKTNDVNKTELKSFIVSLSEATYKTFKNVVPYNGIPKEKYMDLLIQLKFKFAPTVTHSGSQGLTYDLQQTITEMGICYSFNSNLAIYNSPRSWQTNNWSLMPENQTLSVHPLDGEVFANVINMSTGFNIAIEAPTMAGITSTPISLEEKLDYFLKMLRIKVSSTNPQNTVKVSHSNVVSRVSILDASLSFLTLFFSVSTIHGFSQIAAKRRHSVEILIWLSLLGCAVYGASVLSSEMWSRYQENPTVISMERDRYSWNTTFPPATICPEMKLSTTKLDEYIQKSNAENKTELRSFLISLSGATYKTFQNVIPYDRIPSEQYMDLLMQLQFEFFPSLSHSGIHGLKFDLQETVTEMGICYSFNSNLAVYNSPRYWEINSWSLLPLNQTFYVHPLDGEVFANVVNMSTGFYMFLHGPYETVDVASKGIYSSNGHFLQMYLTGLTIITTDRARDLSVAQRKCRFYDESNLRHSPVYSYILCRMECRAALSKRLCNCVPHFYRNLEGERICDVSGMHCLAKYAERLIALRRECSCFPNCNEVNYVVEDIDSRDWFLGSNLQWGLKEYPRMRLRRDVIFGFTDVLVYVGGMAGLFLGCSVLSFIEIVYFFTIRLFWFVLKYGTETRQM